MRIAEFGKDFTVEGEGICIPGRKEPEKEKAVTISQTLKKKMSNGKGEQNEQMEIIAILFYHVYFSFLEQS